MLAVGSVGCGVGLAVFAQDVPPSDPPEKICYNRKSIGKCGTDMNLEPVQCGDVVCYRTMITYDTLYERERAEVAGRANIMDAPCNKRTVKQACIDNQCTMVPGGGEDPNPKVELVDTGCKPTGPLCKDDQVRLP